MFIFRYKIQHCMWLCMLCMRCEVLFRGKVIVERQKWNGGKTFLLLTDLQKYTSQQQQQNNHTRKNVQRHESMTPKMAYASLSFQNEIVTSQTPSKSCFVTHSANSKIFGNVFFFGFCFWFVVSVVVLFIYVFRLFLWLFACDVCFYFGKISRKVCTCVPKPVASTHCAIIVLILDEILLHKCWFGFFCFCFLLLWVNVSAIQKCIRCVNRYDLLQTIALCCCTHRFMK